MRIVSGSLRTLALAALAGLLLFLPARGDAQASIPATDSAAILATVERWERAWEIKDASLAAQDYAATADFTNAFGMRRVGHAAILELLTEVFSLPFVMAGSTKYEYHDFMSLSPSIVLLRSRAIRTGQQLPDGTVEEPRKTSHLRVFRREDGAWRIVSHLIGDERTPGAPR